MSTARADEKKIRKTRTRHRHMHMHSRRAMGKGGIVLYFWGADACEKRLAWPKYCS